MFRTALGDIEAAVAALECSLECKPDYAPAILSMGSVEYQRGRNAQGRGLFHSLLALPADTTDLCEFIDQAGSFLIQWGAYDDGLELYREAVGRSPNVAVFHQGVGCCAGNQRLHAEAIEASRRALELEPGNQQLVNDLGWSLFEAGRLEKARETLERAVSMDPADELARENLRVCTQETSKSLTNEDS